MAELIVLMLGLAVGSFLNVCIYRMPRDLSLVHPGSCCPACGHKIRWYDNIPVLGYVFLRGKCRDCGARISPRYAAVELLNAALWIFLLEFFGSGLMFVFSALLFSILLGVIFTDLETGLIPDEFSLGGLAAGLLFAVLVPQAFHAADWKASLVFSGAGALTGAALLYGTGLIGQLVFRKESMGLGDVKLLAALGAFTGVPDILFIFFIAPVLALPAALYDRYVRREETIPFGPYLAAAGALVFLWGDELQRFFWG